MKLVWWKYQRLSRFRLPGLWRSGCPMRRSDSLPELTHFNETVIYSTHWIILPVAYQMSSLFFTKTITYLNIFCIEIYQCIIIFSEYMYRQSLIIIYDEIVHNLLLLYLYILGKGHFIILYMYYSSSIDVHKLSFTDLNSNAGLMYMYIIY